MSNSESYNSKKNFILRNIRKLVNYIVNYCFREARDQGVHVTRYTGNIIQNSGMLLFKPTCLYHLSLCVFLT